MSTLHLPIIVYRYLYLVWWPSPTAVEVVAANSFLLSRWSCEASSYVSVKLYKYFEYNSNLVNTVYHLLIMFIWLNNLTFLIYLWVKHEQILRTNVSIKKRVPPSSISLSNHGWPQNSFLMLYKKLKLNAGKALTLAVYES